MTEGWILAARQDEVHNPRREHEDRRESHPLAGQDGRGGEPGALRGQSHAQDCQPRQVF